MFFLGLSKWVHKFCVALSFSETCQALNNAPKKTIILVWNDCWLENMMMAALTRVIIKIFPKLVGLAIRNNFESQNWGYLGPDRVRLPMRTLHLLSWCLPRSNSIWWKNRQWWYHHVTLMNWSWKMKYIIQSL